MLAPMSSLLKRVGVAIEVMGLVGVVVAGASSLWRGWPLSLVPEDTSGLWLLGFALLGATGAALAAKAGRPSPP